MLLYIGLIWYVFKMRYWFRPSGKCITTRLIYIYSSYRVGRWRCGFFDFVTGNNFKYNNFLVFILEFSSKLLWNNNDSGDPSTNAQYSTVLCKWNSLDWRHWLESTNITQNPSLCMTSIFTTHCTSVYEPIRVWCICLTHIGQAYTLVLAKFSSHRERR